MKILIVFCCSLVFFGCKNSKMIDSPFTIYKEYQKDKVYELFGNYEVKPVLRGRDKILISFPNDSIYFYVGNYSSADENKLIFINSPNPLDDYYNSFKINENKNVLIKAHRILKKLEERGIIAIQQTANGSFFQIHTNYHINNESSKLVFIYKINKKVEFDKEYFFDIEGEIVAFDEDWCCYKSNLYKNYNRFK